MGFLVELLVRGTIVLAVALALGSIPGLRRAELRGALLSVALLVMLALPALVGAGAHLPVGVLPSRDARAISEAQTDVLLRVGVSTPNASPGASVATTGDVDGQLFAESSPRGRKAMLTGCPDAVAASQRTIAPMIQRSQIV